MRSYGWDLEQLPARISWAGGLVEVRSYSELFEIDLFGLAPMLEKCIGVALDCDLIALPIIGQHLLLRNFVFNRVFKWLFDWLHPWP